VTLRRTFPTTVGRLWDLWTTKKGLESWWAPDGFSVEVRRLDLRVGGEVEYTMTAVAPEMVAFLSDSGMPRTTVATWVYSEIVPKERLTYAQLVDFVPGVEPYDVTTWVEFRRTPKGVTVVVTEEALHSEEWTLRALEGLKNGLRNLAKLLKPSASARGPSPRNAARSWDRTRGR
jgi:uncharacterized protein YndB with AHSA1/START domain